MLEEVVIGVVLVVVAAATVRAAGEGRALLATDFESDPQQGGWTLGGHPHQKPKGEWTDATSVSGTRALRVDAGWWSSPRLKVEPLAYYRLAFHAAVEGKGYWWVAFFNERGEHLASDHYSGIYPSDEWRADEFCFRARHDATAAEVRFQAIAAPLFVDDVRVEAISRPDVAAWAHRTYRAMPPAELGAVPRMGKLLARTIVRLRQGGALRIVLLGDSIVNDIGNSPWDALLERAWPGARIEVVHSVRGGTGCPYYRAENRVQSYVLDHKPDLLIIGGISNGDDPEAIREVIRQVRAKSDPDILVMSGAVSRSEDLEAFFEAAKFSLGEREEARRRALAYRPGLAAMAAKEKVAYFDLREHWDAYVARIRKHPEWLLRDRPHANCRGHMVLAQLMAAYFAPDAAGTRLS